MAERVRDIEHWSALPESKKLTVRISNASVDESLSDLLTAARLNLRGELRECLSDSNFALDVSSGKIQGEIF